tara:strand:- start:652 stop:945 length:294 start_codon:yes stop_codon:yes gene_type:complete
MATAKTTSSRAKAPKADDSAKALAALEAKVAGLEGALASLKSDLTAHSKASDEAHAKLEAQCKACCDASASSGSGLSAEEAGRLQRVWAFCRKLGLR